MSASVRREALEREAPAASNDEAQRPLPPPEDYVERVRSLHAVALARSELEPLVDAMTSGLAWVMFSLNRPEVTADVLTRLGRHIDGFAERERAERELEAMKERGERLIHRVPRIQFGGMLTGKSSHIGPSVCRMPNLAK